MKSIKTILGNIRLWATISTALFLACWFLPCVNNLSAAEVCVNFFKHHFNLPADEKLQMLGLAIFLFGIISLVFGWALQFPISFLSAALFQTGRTEEAGECDPANAA